MRVIGGPSEPFHHFSFRSGGNGTGRCYPRGACTKFSSSLIQHGVGKVGRGPREYFLHATKPCVRKGSDISNSSFNLFTVLAVPATLEIKKLTSLLLLSYLKKNLTDEVTAR